MRMRLTCWTALSVFGIALVTPAFAQTETNQIRGRLGYYRFKVAEVITSPEITLRLSDAQESRPKDAGGPATQQKVTSEILLDALPNPLTLRVVNTQHEAFRFSTFMSSNASMPPMPNVRVEARDTSSGRIRTCTPVVLTEKRASLVLKPGEAKDIQVYHRGFVAGLPEGTYAVTVSLFDDADSAQQTPIAVSRSITVKISSRDR